MTRSSDDRLRAQGRRGGSGRISESDQSKQGVQSHQGGLALGFDTRIVCGVDEAGRGPLAGPVVAAAVILDPARAIDGLRDSKKLSEARREWLASAIRERELGRAHG